MPRLFDNTSDKTTSSHFSAEKVALGLVLAALLMPAVAGLIAGHRLVEALVRPAALISFGGLVVGIVKKNPALIGASLLAFILNAALSAAKGLPF